MQSNNIIDGIPEGIANGTSKRITFAGVKQLLEILSNEFTTKFSKYKIPTEFWMVLQIKSFWGKLTKLLR